MARVCVGISVYRQPLNWLQQAIQSVRNQSFQDWELIVRLDGPAAVESNCYQWLQEVGLKETRFRLIEGAKNLGTFGSYRAVFEQSRAEFLVQLDADDWLDPRALELSLKAMGPDSTSPFLYTQCVLVDDTGQSIGLDQRACHAWEENIDLVQFITFHLRLVKRSAYEQVGGYQSDRFFTGDYDLSLRLAELGRPIFLRQPLYFYRLHPASTSQRRLLDTHCEAVIGIRQALKRRSLDDRSIVVYSRKCQCVSLVRNEKIPIFVAGMHRCGTSLLSRLLQIHGVDFGADFIAADADNPAGY